MYFLKENVYIVNGAKKDCIYNLNDGKLYNIEKNVTELIYKAGVSNTLILTETESKFLKELESLGIIECKSQGENKDISTIKIKNTIKMAWIEVCTNCNLKCIHCYNESSSKCYDFMTLEDFKIVCGKLKEYGIKRIQLIGGEPFCNPEIQSMIKYVANMFESVEIFTNATLLNENLIRLIKESNIKIAISIYSYLPEEHDKITKISGSHSKTINNIALLKKYGVKYRTSNILMDGLSLGEKNTDLFELQNYRCVIKMSGRGNIRSLNPELLKLKLITPKTFSKKIYKELVAENVSGHPCFGQKIYVSAALDVYPCAMERRLLHGNLRSDSLEKILSDSILEFSKDNIEGCKDCEFRYACYDCRPDSLTKDLHSKPYNCTYDVYNGQWISPEKMADDILSNI